jgi:hypothetical protein
MTARWSTRRQSRNPNGGIQHRVQLTDLGRGELAPGTAGPLRGQRGPAASSQRPPRYAGYYGHDAHPYIERTKERREAIDLRMRRYASIAITKDVYGHLL